MRRIKGTHFLSRYVCILSYTELQAQICIDSKPVVNPMLGPSQSAIINAGARFPPCMKLVQDLLPDTLIPCEQDHSHVAYDTQWLS